MTGVRRLNGRRAPICAEESGTGSGLHPAIAHRGAQEIIMAKGQKRGNRETRKPKTKKEPPVANVSSLLKGMSTPVSLPKKKS
jgi:hypothetical protein